VVLKSDQLLLKDVYSLLEAAEAEFNDGSEIEHVLLKAMKAANTIQDRDMYLQGINAVYKRQLSNARKHGFIPL